jgi:hypothetical protein
MNIVEAYIKFKGQLIILVSGLSGSGMTHLAKSISDDFKLKLVSYKDFLKKDYDKKDSVQINNTVLETVNWDTDDVIEWDSFMKEINDNKKSGLVAVCPSFPLDKIKDLFVPDVHINIKLSKQNLLKKRLEFNKNKNLSDEDLTIMFNKFTFPYYLQTTDQSKTKITRFINANDFIDLPQDEYDEKVYDEAFSYLISSIARWLGEYHRTDEYKMKRSKQ